MGTRALVRQFARGPYQSFLTGRTGTEIAFIPPFRMFPYSMPPFATGLIVRIDEARRADGDGQRRARNLPVMEFVRPVAKFDPAGRSTFDSYVHAYHR
jgi:hypothetical protein